MEKDEIMATFQEELFVDWCTVGDLSRSLVLTAICADGKERRWSLSADAALTLMHIGRDATLAEIVSCAAAIEMTKEALAIGGGEDSPIVAHLRTNLVTYEDRLRKLERMYADEVAQRSGALEADRKMPDAARLLQ